MGHSVLDDRTYAECANHRPGGGGLVGQMSRDSRKSGFELTNKICLPREAFGPREHASHGAPGPRRVQMAVVWSFVMPDFSSRRDGVVLTTHRTKLMKRSGERWGIRVPPPHFARPRYFGIGMPAGSSK
jgi:hypothetical protein